MTVQALKPFSDEVWRRIRTQDKLQFYEGPVRSGKTLATLISLAGFIMTHDVEQGIMSGNTQASVIRNCVKSKPGLLSILPDATLVERDGSKQILVPKGNGKEVVIYLFGADKADSEDSLRGLTIDFWYADEVTKHHLNFINEAFSRSAASDHPFMIWTSNPESPNNPIYKEYTDRFLAMSPEDNLAFGGYHEFHFQLSDNPVMTPKKIKALELNYTGVEYERKILGRRCISEGLVYPRVDASFFRPVPDNVDIRYCAIDFGTDHPTVMVFGGMVGRNKKDWRIVAMYYDEKSDKTTYDHYLCFLDMCERLKVDPNRMTVAIDPAAKVLRLEFMRHGIQPIKAKNAVLEGIAFTRNVIYNGILSFGPLEDLRPLYDEFGTYAWDRKASERGEDKPVKIRDDGMDATRYFANTFMKPVIGGIQ